MARVIREVEPEWVFVENVDALVIRGLDIVLWTLAELGFDAEWGVLGADECGAPHQRDRAFILAHANGGRQQGERGDRLLDGVRQTYGNHANGRERTASSAVADSPSKCRSQQPFVDDDRGTLECAVARTIRGVESGAVTAGISFRGRADVASPTCLSEWPPSPDDMLAWRGVPKVLEPSLCRMAYGMANRVDDLRACGNGVVPVVAAVAFLALRERLESRVTQ